MFSSVKFQFNLFESSGTLTQTSDSGSCVDVKHSAYVKLYFSHFYNIFLQSLQSGLRQSQSYFFSILRLNDVIQTCIYIGAQNELWVKLGPVQGCQGSRSSAFRSQGTRTHFKIHFYPFLNTMECSHNLFLSFHQRCHNILTLGTHYLQVMISIGVSITIP